MPCTAPGGRIVCSSSPAADRHCARGPAAPLRAGPLCSPLVRPNRQRVRAVQTDTHQLQEACSPKRMSTLHLPAGAAAAAGRPACSLPNRPPQSLLTLTLRYDRLYCLVCATSRRYRHAGPRRRAHRLHRRRPHKAGCAPSSGPAHSRPCCAAQEDTSAAREGLSERQGGGGRLDHRPVGALPLPCQAGGRADLPCAEPLLGTCPSIWQCRSGCSEDLNTVRSKQRTYAGRIRISTRCLVRPSSCRAGGRPAGLRVCKQ